MNVTKWYPGLIKPVHIGVYQRSLNNERGFGFWDGRLWRLTGGTIEDAINLKQWVSHNQHLARWRGCTNDQQRIQLNKEGD